MEDGQCRRPFARSVSRNECCKYEHDVGFTEKEMSDQEFFFASAIGNGNSCNSCIGMHFYRIFHFHNKLINIPFFRFM